MDAALVWLTFVMAMAAAAGAVFSYVQARAATQDRQAAESAAVRAAAAAESSASALIEANRLTVDRIPDQVQIAYQDLLRVMSELVSHTFLDETGPRLLRELRLQMTFLTEQVGDRFPALGTWLEAERQLGLKYALAASTSIDRIKRLDPTTEADIADVPHGLVTQNGVRIGLSLRGFSHATTIPCRVPDASSRARSGR